MLDVHINIGIASHLFLDWLYTEIVVCITIEISSHNNKRERACVQDRHL